MIFNTTFNNIYVISWWSVLLVKESEVHGETTDNLYHINVVSSTPCHEWDSNSQP
jgi:hypothetical protein